MIIIISNSSKSPIYEQISSQIKQKIISGELKEGDELPSMRFLAKELKISVITTKRAYEELIKEGFIISVKAKGCYVAKKNIALEKEVQLQEIESYLQKAVDLAQMYQLPEAELVDLVRVLYRGE